MCLQQLKLSVYAILILSLTSCAGSSNDGTAVQLPADEAIELISESDGVDLNESVSEGPSENPVSNNAETGKSGDHIYQAQVYDLEQEIYDFSVLFEITDAHASLNEGSSVNTIVATHNDHTYAVYVDLNRRPKIVKYSHTTGEIENNFLTDLTYQTRDDDHHRWTIGIDKEGYIHVAGDMHNYAIFPGSIDHMAEQYQVGRVNYWRSNSPEDIRSFIWLGNSDTHAPQGTGHTYNNFVSDQEDNLYFYGRVANNQRQGGLPYKAYRAFNISKYDTETQSWKSLGSQNDFLNESLFWEDNGEDGGTYSKIHAGVSFDLNNKMHVASPLLNKNISTSANHFATHVVYASSDYGVQNLRNSKGEIVHAPMRIDNDGVHDQAEIVYKNESEFLATYVSVVADYLGRPIVMLNDQAKTGNQFVRLENGEWVNHGDLGLSDNGESLLGNDSNMAIDRMGVITIVRDYKYLTRMWTVDGQIRTITLPNMSKALKDLNIDNRHLMKTGNIIGTASRHDASDPLQIIQIKVSRPDGYIYPFDEASSLVCLVCK